MAKTLLKGEIDSQLQQQRPADVRCMLCKTPLLSVAGGAYVRFVGRSDERLDFWLHQTCASAIATEADEIQVVLRLRGYGDE